MKRTSSKKQVINPGGKGLRPLQIAVENIFPYGNGKSAEVEKWRGYDVLRVIEDPKEVVPGIKIYYTTKSWAHEVSGADSEIKFTLVEFNPRTKWHIIKSLVKNKIVWIKK